jgi:outer membrane phospholipase A
MKSLWMLGFLAVTIVASAQETVVSLLAPTGAVPPAREVRISLLVVNLSPAVVTYELPGALAGRLVTEHQSWPVELQGAVVERAQLAAGGAVRRDFILRLPPDALGRLVLEIEQPAPARCVLDVAAPSPLSAGSTPAVALSAKGSFAQPVVTQIERTVAGRFSTHEPIYFIYGRDAPAAKFQFSFKYRLLSDSGVLGAGVPALRGLHLAYTQRSLWDIQAKSSPFFDTSYMPELIGEWQAARSLNPGPVQWLGQQLSIQHESNGRDGPTSRSVNNVYYRPGVIIGDINGWNLILSPKIFVYVGDLSNNPDISKYRGYGEFRAAFGKNERFGLSFTGRLGEHFNKGSMQFDLTLPMRSRLIDFASYFMVQYFDGYGESLLEYNQHSSTVRAGFSLVR